MRSKYGPGWGVIYAGEYCWDYHGKKIYDFDIARLVAFNLFDEMYNSRRERNLIRTMTVGYTKNKKKMIVLLLGKLNKQYYIY